MVSQSKEALVVDCGDESVIREIQAMQALGELGAVEWLWISHYHDDHVDAIPQFQETFGCPVVADRSVAQVVEHPLAWKLPCISPHTVAVDRLTQDGESFRWREFTIAAYHLPGQTLYIMECEPAAYSALAANEAEKAADINILEVRSFGSFGRLYLGGEERDIDVGYRAAVAAVESVSGRPREQK